MPSEDEIPPPVRPSAALFRPRATTLFRAALLLGGLGLCLAALSGFEYYHSPYWNRIGIAPDQPVLFSHRHHAGELGIDCRYCHATAETSAFAGMPSTHTCMTCHSQLFTQAPLLRPVWNSAEQNLPLHWRRVTSLPDHVYFNHSIHLAKGVACMTCHGEVGRMALLAKGEPLTMHWCIECHRDPGPRLQPRSELFRATAHSGEPTGSAAAAPAVPRGIEHLTDCSTCHH